MMVKFFLTCICIMFVFASSVRAQELRLLPEYLPCTYKGQRYACYSLEQQKKLNLLEKQALTWRAQLSSYEVIAVNINLERANFNEQIAEADKMVKFQTEYADSLRKQQLQCIEERNEWRAKAEKVNIWPWVIGGGLALGGLGLALGVFLAK